MKLEQRRIWERVAIISGMIGGLFFVAALTLMLTTAPIIASALCLPIGFIGLLFGIMLTLYLRRGVSGDSWPRSGRKAPR
ncbi:MAG: hypothetical protein JWP75_970 [Frondihabitans sp.]|nr:hypothetical protein [Frondihabitans sp.]